MEGKTVAELREIAKALGLEITGLSKKEIIAKIAGDNVAGGEQETSSETVSEERPKRGRRPRVSGVKVGGNTPRKSEETAAVAVADAPAEVV